MVKRDGKNASLTEMWRLWHPPAEPRGSPINAHGIEITMTLAILFGLVMLWSFW
jgi:hypothetical protein